MKGTLILEFRLQGGSAAGSSPGQRSITPEAPCVSTVRVPRVARLLALAIRFEELVQRGEVPNYAALAQLGHLSRARVSQIMNLLLLAPDIQEELLFLPGNERGRDAIHLAQLQPIALESDWRRQRVMWRKLRKRAAID